MQRTPRALLLLAIALILLFSTGSAIAQTTATPTATPDRPAGWESALWLGEGSPAPWPGYLLAPPLAMDLIQDMEDMERGLRRERLLTDELKLQRDAYALDVKRLEISSREEEILRVELEEELLELKERHTTWEVLGWMGAAALISGAAGFVGGLIVR